METLNRVNLRTRIYRLRKLWQIAREVEMAENLLKKSGQLRPILPSDPKSTCYTSAPRCGLYAPTPAGIFSRNMEFYGFSPALRFAELGFGLGGICFAARMHFFSVTGFELDPSLWKESRMITHKLGFNDVMLLNEDFLKYEKINDFDIFFACHPFRENFDILFIRFLDKLDSGKTVIARILADEKKIFPHNRFEQIYPKEYFLKKYPGFPFFLAYRKL